MTSCQRVVQRVVPFSNKAHEISGCAVLILICMVPEAVSFKHANDIIVVVDSNVKRMALFTQEETSGADASGYKIICPQSPLVAHLPQFFHWHAGWFR